MATVEEVYVDPSALRALYVADLRSPAMSRWRMRLDGAARLSRQYAPKPGTRALDVLHVASALELRARHFVTYDVRQSHLAANCGLKVVQP